MNSNTLIVLAGLAAAAAVGAFVLGGDKDPAAVSGAERGAFLPDVQADINGVARIVLQQGQNRVDVQQQGGAWVLASHGGYPAKFEQAKETLLQLSKLEIRETKTSNPDHHERLGLLDSAAAEGTREVQLFDTGGTEIAAFLVGNSTARDRDSNFVRRKGQDQCYQVRGELGLSANLSDWAERQVLKLEAESVFDVTIEQADGERVELARDPLDPSGTPFVVGVPEGRELSQDGIANTTFGSLANLNFDNVRAAQDVTLENPTRTTFRCKDGLILELDLAEVEGTWWMKLAASQDEDLVPLPAAPGELISPAGEGQEDRVSEDEPAQIAFNAQLTERAALLGDARKEAQSLNASHAPWAYAIPSWGATNLTKRMQGFLKAPVDPSIPSDIPGNGAGAPAMDQEQLQQLLREAGVNPEDLLQQAQGAAGADGGN